MKRLALALCAVSAMGLAAASDPAPTAEDLKKMSPEERRENFERRTGGMVRREAEGPKIVVVDGRKTPGKALKYFEQENIEARGTKPGLPAKTYSAVVDGDVITEALATLEREKGAMAIVIVNGGAKMPGVTACPEDRVAAINADRYDNKDFLVLKEIWRAIGFVGGVGYSKYSSDPMQPVFSTKELEGVEGTALLPMSLNALKTFTARLGMKPAYSLPYIAACRQGWAPAPTNDVQRAIWNEVRQLPTKPVTIEFDPKRGK